LAEAIGQGVLPTSSLQRASLRTAYLQRAAAQSEDLFSALVASALLDQSGEAVIQAAQAAEAVTVPAPGVGPARAEEALHAERFLTSLLRYGLLDRAYAIARENAGLIQPQALMELSDALTASGRIRESIQVGMRIVAGDETDHGPGGTGDLLSADVFRRRYPLGFATAFDEVLAQESIDRWVLFALVREESLFDPEIVSRAGAIGLTQLLPATADDVARRMRIDPPDLTDPLQNLRVGARYLAMLDAQFGGLVKAVAAYNAGQGRVRSWERQRPDLDGVLFHQSVPFEETYNHIRNIVVSAAYYGYLYEGRSPTDTIRIVFGNLQTVGE
ncbi:MAG: lytic transglycosylase domain-containing protein, partial [Spirochaetales bacterium]|nr:lytic transglycosylase domain-containing protein [Spirochaetales bacterium]